MKFVVVVIGNARERVWFRGRAIPELPARPEPRSERPPVRGRDRRGGRLRASSSAGAVSAVRSAAGSGPARSGRHAARGRAARALVRAGVARPARVPRLAAQCRLNRMDVVQQAETTESFEAAAASVQSLLANVERVVRGKSEQIKLVLAALACEGHVLFEDVPGTAKTVLAGRSPASDRGCRDGRIQCTPDLQPTDVTGLSIWNPERSAVRVPGRAGVRATSCSWTRSTVRSRRRSRRSSRRWPSAR